MNDNLLEKLKLKPAREDFSQRPVPDDLMGKLLDAANHAPSGFNMQPWHFLLLEDSNLKKLCYHIALEQRPVLEAPVTVIFIADPTAWKGPYSEVLRLGVESGALSKDEASMFRQSMNLFFDSGLWGLKGLLRRITMPYERMAKPTARYHCSKAETEAWVNSQTMFAAGSFYVTARAAELTTSVIMNFDEKRLKKLLGIPKEMIVPIMISTGYLLDEETPRVKEVRFPIDDKVSRNLFGNTRRMVKSRTES